MRKQILPVSEIERNKRVRELMSNRIPRHNSQSNYLTQEEFDEMKEHMKKGYKRDEAIKIVRATNKLLNKNK